MSVLICFALKEEAAPFRKIAAGKLTWISQINTDFLIRENLWNPCQKSGISILLTGIGRQNAEKSLRKFLATHLPELVLTCGFAGGLNPDLKLGEVIFETSDENLRGKILGGNAKPAKFFCADRIAITIAEKKNLRDETGADAVEMESAAIQEICRAQKISCATVRVISDTANENLPLDFNAFAKPDKNLDYGKLALAIAKSPAKIFALKKLQKQTQFAAQQLANVLQKIIFP